MEKATIFTGCFECDKESEEFNEGAKYVLMYLASLYSGLTETDIWQEFFPEEKEGQE
jgi:hypothetical protein